MSKFTAKQYASALYDLTNKAPSDIKGIIKKFVATLAENGDFSQVGSIVEEFDKICLSAEGKEKIEITTAHGDDRGLKSSLEGEIVSKKDEKVLGGVRIRVGDKLVDNTLAARVGRLKESLGV